jgi:hypothetical protein
VSAGSGIGSDPLYRNATIVVSIDWRLAAGLGPGFWGYSVAVSCWLVGVLLVGVVSVVIDGLLVLMLSSSSEQGQSTTD